jgi:NitT/TauT family transport system permease protein
MARDNLPLASTPTLPISVASNPRQFVPRFWISLVLVIVAVAFVFSVLQAHLNTDLDSPLFATSTVGLLGTWIADQSTAADSPALLVQLARSLNDGAQVEAATVNRQMLNGLIVVCAATLLLTALGAVTLWFNLRLARSLLLGALIGQVLLIFTVPPLEDTPTFGLLILATAFIIGALLGAPGRAGKLVAFISILASLLVLWEGLKAFGSLMDYRIAIPQSQYAYQTFASVEDTLRAVQDGTIRAAVLETNDIAELVPERGGDTENAALAYTDLLLLGDLQTELAVGPFPIRPEMPGRLSIVTQAAAADQFTSISQFARQRLGTVAGSTGEERFLAVQPGLVLLDMRITNDLGLPHLQTIASSLLQPARRNGDLLLIRILSEAGLFTWSEALIGFVFGGLLGFVLGALCAHSRFLERGFLPYIVASQTVPILAIAPIIVIWAGQADVDLRLAVAVIAAYLTFFPVTINTLRGLTSPNPTALELMKSYAADWWTVLWKLRFPAALPYIFTALKVSATASVVGAVIGELPSGIGEGLGRAILNFNQYYATDPARLWAAIFVAALVGIVFFLLIALAERIVLGKRGIGASS